MTEPLSSEAILRIIDARRRLQGIVERTRNSFKCQDYRRRREAALKGRTA